MHCWQESTKYSKAARRSAWYGTPVGAMDIATANNTVAIVMANPIARIWQKNTDHTEKDSFDTGYIFLYFSGIIPYGAQMLVAISRQVNWISCVGISDYAKLFYHFCCL